MKIIPTAGVLIINEDRVLLVRHKKTADRIIDTYGLPAGKIENNETEIAAAQRELTEETGLKTKIDNLIQYPGNSYKAKIKTKNGEENIYPYKIFICTNFFDNLEEKIETSAEWVRLSDVPLLNLLPNVEKIINDGLKFIHGTYVTKKLKPKLNERP